MHKNFYAEDIAQSQGGFGARRTELVFIGTGYDETAIRNLLDSCLLSDVELAQSQRINA